MNCPGAPRQMLNETAWGAPGMPGDNGNLSMWDLYLQNGVQGFSLELPYLTPDFIKGAHARLLPVNAWTVDTEDDMQKAIDLGVSGILTDDAPQVIAVVNARIQEAMAYKNGGGSGKYSGGAMAGAIIGSVLAGSIVGLIGSLFIFKRGAISWGKAGKTGATAGTKTDGFYVPVAQTPEAMA
jgi:Glycerophosphoryl diester phosphodiesterase family